MSPYDEKPLPEPLGASKMIQKTNKTKFQDSFSEEVWSSTYKNYNDVSVDDTLFRVAKAVADMEETPELRTEWTNKFYDMLSDFKVTVGGRIYSNAGTEWKGTTLANCFVGPHPKSDMDSLDGILKVLRDQAQTLKSEGGWGFNFSFIRPRGAFIHGVGVETPGSVKYMELFDKSSEIVTSGSGLEKRNKKAKGKIRKGAMMGVLDVWHPDIIEFITAKQTPGRLTKFNVSVNCSDEFMNKILEVERLKEQGAAEEEIQAVDNWDLRFPDTTHSDYDATWKGDLNDWEAKGNPVEVYRTVSASWLWNLIMESTYNRAEPGVLFLDRANKVNPLNYKETIFATNPCVTSDTWVQTSEGPRQVNDLIGKPFISVLNNMNYISGPDGFFKTGEKEVFEIQTKSGKVLRGTSNHKVSVYQNGEYVWKEIGELSTNDSLRTTDQDLTWSGKGTEGEGYLLGSLVGDGTIPGGSKAILSLWGDDAATKDIREYVKSIVMEELKPSSQFKGWSHISNRNEYRLSCAGLTSLARKYELTEDKFNLEKIEKTSSDFHIGFLRGMFDADGSVQGSIEGGASVRLSQSNIGLLRSVQRMLHRLNIKSHIYENRNGGFGKQMLPNGKGGYKEYTVKPQHELCVVKSNLIEFSKKIGFINNGKNDRLQHIVSSYVCGPYSNKPYDKIVSIKSIGVEAVYDVQIPNINAFDANGFYVHNCGEQTLSPGNICNLGSINLTQFVNSDRTGFDIPKLKKYTQYLVRFLDNINTLSDTPLDEYKYSMSHKRRIGTGILGWGSALYMLKVRFGSDEADHIRDEVMQTITHTAVDYSVDLALEKGMFSECEPEKHAESKFFDNINLPEQTRQRIRENGIRNSSIFSIQPTGNTSIFANVVSGGLEPIFMPEYVRTVIVNTIPEEIKEVTPKFYAGEFHETSMFKLTKEGDEEILKGVSPSGITYKIDKNRGLTKEVLCEDYGVRFLKSVGEWDPNADWAVTTLNLTTQDHVRDLIGFSKWLDSACSKTVNVPHDYSFDEFKNVYLDSYNSGYVKGVTTYRAGTMTSVLSAKEEKFAEDSDEEVITDSIKLPSSSPAMVKKLKAEGKKWYLTVVMNEEQTRPFALFVHTNSHEKSITTSDAVDRLFSLARRKGIPEEWVSDTEKKVANENNVSKIARAISLCLRHGVLIKNVVAELERVEDVFVGTFLFQIKKFLSQYIKDGEKVEDAKCDNCKSTDIVFSEGCFLCKSCGSSRCG